MLMKMLSATANIMIVFEKSATNKPLMYPVKYAILLVHGHGYLLKLVLLLFITKKKLNKNIWTKRGLNPGHLAVESTLITITKWIT